MTTLRAGAAAVDISPRDSQFLYGYPHVARFSTGIHDPLFATALFLTDGRTALMFISNDIIFVGKASAQRARRLIEEKTGIPAGNIMITATHTHSGPITVDYVNSKNDPVVPGVDKEYVEFMERKMINAACRAFDNASPAEIAFAVVDGTGIGTNRHDPKGPAIMDIPLMVVR